MNLWTIFDSIITRAHNFGGIIMDKDIFENAKKWVLKAGKRIKEGMYQPMEIDTKSDPNDLVTSLDKDTEKYFNQKIKETYPHHKLFGEEGFGDEIKSLKGTIWIVDPIDGTTNFVHQGRNFCISVGIYKNGIGEIGIIYDVILEQLYVAKRNKGAYKNGKRLKKLREDLPKEEAILGINHFLLCQNRLVDYRATQDLVRKVRGVRSYGSAALQFAYVAEGVLDGYLALRLSPWDVAAGMILVNEVGGKTTNLFGESLDMLSKDSLLTSNGNIHVELIRQYE